MSCVSGLTICVRMRAIPIVVYKERFIAVREPVEKARDGLARHLPPLSGSPPESPNRPVVSYILLTAQQSRGAAIHEIAFML